MHYICPRYVVKAVIVTVWFPADSSSNCAHAFDLDRKEALFYTGLCGSSATLPTPRSLPQSAGVCESQRRIEKHVTTGHDEAVTLSTRSLRERDS